MSDRLKAFWLGFFIIVALVLLAWLILFLKPGLGNGEVRLRVHFSNIDKVTKGTRVTYAGKPVGTVEELVEISDPRAAPADALGNLYIYELILCVDSAVKVFTYDEIIFATSGLLGEKSIAIIPKSPPPGAPAARDVTCEILYARSTDRIEQTLNKLVNVSETLQNTLEQVSSFLKTNERDFNVALKSFSGCSKDLNTLIQSVNERRIADKLVAASDILIAAMTKADDFFAMAQQQELIERMSWSFENIARVTDSMIAGEGTFARLLNSDCFFVQFTTVLCQLHAILDDIRAYGLLYQFDRKWQRSKR